MDEGGRDGAHQKLEKFWLSVSTEGSLDRPRRRYINAWLAAWNSILPAAKLASEWTDALSQFVNPYAFNPLNVNPPRAHLIAARRFCPPPGRGRTGFRRCPGTLLSPAPNVPIESKARLAGRGLRFSKSEGRKSKSTRKENQRKEKQNPRIFYPPIEIFQRLKPQNLEDAILSISAQPFNKTSKSNSTRRRAFSLARPPIRDPTAAGTIARFSDYRKALSPFLSLAHDMSGLGSARSVR
jgi:hypothetical protein